MREYDFSVVGPGAGGLSAALHAAEHGRVAILTKRSMDDSNSTWAQGGIACVQSEEDSIEQHVSDTLIAGGGLCKEDAVRTIVTEGPDRIEELVKWGVHFDQREASDGHLEFDLTREGGHSARRIVHATDATNAARTALFDIRTGDWDDDLLAAFRVPRQVLPEVRDCNAQFGTADATLLGAAIPTGPAHFFLKMTGPPAAVDAQPAAFRQLAQSARLGA